MILFTYKVVFDSTGGKGGGSIKLDARNFCDASKQANKRLNQMHNKTGHDFSIRSILLIGQAQEQPGFAGDLEANRATDLD